LNPKYYNNDWLNVEPSHIFPPHMDGYISHGGKEAFRRIYQYISSLDEVEEGFLDFSIGIGRFGGYDVLREKGVKKPYVWWATHGESFPIKKHLAMKILSQVNFSSCCNKNWVKYGNLYSLKKRKLEKSKVETMVHVHSITTLIL
jgi:hypothetical protein